jgi:hypothetical protein
MYAMQYEITLPADYDMAIINERVATRGSTLDDRAGLGLKAYLTRMRGRAGSQVNQYAPFYLWTDISAMGHFLWGGGGFAGIIASFGRPRVMHWTGVAFETGSSFAETPLAATRDIQTLAADDDADAAVARAVHETHTRAQLSGVHSTAVAVDPSSWRVVHFTLWDHRDDPGVDGERYDVLHLSAPHVDRLLS